MEDGLVPADITVETWMQGIVLILVVMEDGLVRVWMRGMKSA